MVGIVKETLRAGDREFTFELHRKQDKFADVEIDHWWLDQRTLYGQRNTRRRIAPLADCFWALCEGAATTSERDVQESYILAKLIPYARSNAARGVFQDARPGRLRDPKRRREFFEELERTITQGCAQPIDVLGFHRTTADLLGPPEYDNQDRDRYAEFAAELLDRSCASLQRGNKAAWTMARKKWKDALSKWGRRAGHEAEKRVLNAFSYECRAAVHRCYSALWDELSWLLFQKHALSEANLRFLRFWHLDISWDPPAQGQFSLFHGHIFGLHPASGLLLQTLPGRDVLGAWLSDLDSAGAFGRVLRAIQFCLFAYHERSEETAQSRRKSPSFSDDPEAIQAVQETFHRGIRHPRGQRPRDE